MTAPPPKELVLRRGLQVLGGAALGLLVALLVVGNPFSSSPPLPGNGGAGTVEPDPYPAPSFTLTDQDGRRVSLEDFRGRTVLLFFGFTHCPDVCPGTLANMSRALEALGDRADEVQGILVTVDPERDSPERLGEYLDSFDPSLLGLTGEPAELERVADAFGVVAARTGGDADPHAGHREALPEGAALGTPGEEAAPEAVPDEPGDYLVEHTARTFVIDGEGLVVGTLPPGATAEEMEAEIRSVADGA